jgi:hypothetical protein
MNRFKRVRCIGLPFTAALASLILFACAPLSRSDAVPVELEDRVTVLGMTGFRYWGDGDSAEIAQAGLKSLSREWAHLAASGHQGPPPPADFLAISGGGEDGAFGAGLLVGWTAAGTRPTFLGVTGISTGALTAPFAFLGPAYDSKLREIYTSITRKDVLKPNGLLDAVFFNDSLADNAPLRRTVARYFDQSVFEAIAAEYRRGRFLLIGTTDLDARRPVIWDIGKIANSNQPEALDLVREILVASAAIPGVFPPAMIDVEVDGKHYQEMHVDGGAITQVFLYPP